MEEKQEKKVKNVEKKKVKKTKKLNKRILLCLVIIVILIIAIIFALSKLNKNIKSDYKYEETKAITSVLKDSTNKNQDQIKLEDVKIESVGATMTAKAKLTNNGGKINKAQVNLYLYDEENNIRGMGSTSIENIETNASADIAVNILGDYSDLSRYELKIENIER